MPTETPAPRPFLKWAGGKRQLLSEIQERLPENLDDYDTYVEPFIGGGAVMFHLLHRHNFERVIALDINAELILCYKTLQSDVKKVITELRKMRDSYPGQEAQEDRKAFFYAVRSDWNASAGDVFSLTKSEQVKRTAQTIFLNRTCFNGLFRVNSKGLFNVPIGSYKNPSILDEENLLIVSSSIQNVQFHHAQYSHVLHFLGKKTFVYFDPPYRPLTTSSSFTAYSKSGFNDENQEQLAELCRQLDKNGVQFMLSNSDPKNADKKDQFFDDLYDGFRIDRVKANRAINSKGSGRGKITEILVQNYNTERYGTHMASSKDTAWNEIFDVLDIYSHDFNKEPYPISAKEIKTICAKFTETAEKEPRIICYQAQRKDRPQLFIDRGLFILPVKNGYYVLVKETNDCDGYIDIPPITSSPVEFRSSLTFPLRSSEVGDSEMQHVDKAYALGIIQDFCGIDTMFLTIRGRKYCPEFSFSVGSQALVAKGVQTEVDAGYEGEDTVVLIEAKNTKVKDIIIRQMYYPYRQWWHHTKKDTTVLLFEYNEGMYHLWQFEFDNPDEYTSIRLMKSARYNIV